MDTPPKPTVSRFRLPTVSSFDSVFAQVNFQIEIKMHMMLMMSIKINMS
jgi:hypothetical protein